MMLYPTVPDLLKSVPSRYLLCNVAARRARQVSIEEEECGVEYDKQAVTVALEEIEKGEITASLKDEYLR